MKKEKNYLYKRFSFKGAFLRLLLPGILIMYGMNTALTLISIKRQDKENILKNDSGYSQYIYQEKEVFQDKYEKGEITEEVYSSQLENINQITFEGYLKQTKQDYYLAQYKENITESNKKALAVAVASIGSILALGTFELLKFRSILKSLENANLEKENNIYVDDFQIYQ